MRTAGLRRPDYALCECVGAEKSRFGRWFFNWLINLAGKLLTTMLISSAPPSPGGGEAFKFAAWNIRCGRNAGGMTSAAEGLAQTGVGLAVLMEEKLMNNRYTRLVSGFKILASKSTSHNQGGIALLWKENHPGYEVGSAQIVTPNLLTFQSITGEERFYCMGIYTPPIDTMGVEDLRAAWEACPVGCIPLVLSLGGDLNIDFGEPRNKREELIDDFLDDINLVDTSWRFTTR
jgi:hypothetical protein